MNSINLARLKNCMRRAGRGERLTLGFFGGSITQDCSASVHENCYAYRVFRWWQDTFPAAQFHYDVNAGVFINYEETDSAAEKLSTCSCASLHES